MLTCRSVLESCVPSVIMGWFDIAVAVLVGLLSLLTWRRYLSTISDIPGPFLASFTRLWHMMIILEGDQNLELIRLHEKHGNDRRLCT